MVSGFSDGWLNYDVENVHFIHNSDITLTERFVVDKEDWIQYKRLK